MISEVYWERRLGRQPDVLGRKIFVGDEVNTIIGVAPAGFGLFDEASRVDCWTAIDLAPGSNWVQRRMPWMSALAKLKPGVSLEQAQAQMNGIAASLARTYPDTNRNRGMALTPLIEASMRERRQSAVCTSHARSREISLRAALGASRGRLIREFLADGLVLAVPGVAAGLCSVTEGSRCSRRWRPWVFRE